MIESIYLHNFQCHRDLKLELGLSTVFQGGSDHGKTAVLRALYWVIYNEPKGDAYVSTWAYTRTKGGDIRFHPNEWTEATIKVEGHTITRKRDNNFNGYIVDGKEYTALKGGVPDEVNAILNISEVSVQEQFDAPFLLSMTPGEAAQFLNKLAKLEDVSGILAAAKKKAMDDNSAAEKAAVALQEAEEAEKKFDWLEEAQSLADRCECLEKDINGTRTEISSMEDTVAEYDDAARKLVPLDNALKNLPEFEDKSAAIEKCHNGVELLRDYRDALVHIDQKTNALDAIEALGPYPADRDFNRTALERSLSAFDSLGDIDRLKEAEEALAKLGPMPEKIDPTKRLALEDSLRDYDSLPNVDAISASIKELEQSLEGQVCPTCGRPFTAHEAHHAAV